MIQATNSPSVAYAVGVRRSGDRDGRGELRVTESRERRHDAGNDHRDHDRRPGIRGGGLAGQDEDAGADDRADAEGDQVHRSKHALQTMRGLCAVEQRRERFGAKERHCVAA